MPGDRHTLLNGLYASLAGGDATAVEAALDPAFTGGFAEGMPAGGGVHEGAGVAIRDGWWAIGAAYSARAQPQEFIDCEGDRVLVLGRYAGRSRASGAELDAAFMHLWTFAGDRITALRQLTDTARWPT